MEKPMTKEEYLKVSEKKLLDKIERLKDHPNKDQAKSSTETAQRQLEEIRQQMGAKKSDAKSSK